MQQETRQFFIEERYRVLTDIPEQEIKKSRG
jgi:hypothetical protein